MKINGWVIGGAALVVAGVVAVVMLRKPKAGELPARAPAPAAPAPAPAAAPKKPNEVQSWAGLVGGLAGLVAQGSANGLW